MKTEDKKPKGQKTNNDGRDNALKRKRGQDVEEDPKLGEYLSAMRPAAGKRTWENDSILPFGREQMPTTAPEQDSKPENEGTAVKADSDASNDKENHDGTEEDKMKEKPSAEDPEVVANINTIQQTGRLFFRNLAYTVTEPELEDLVSPFGKTDEVRFTFSELFCRVKSILSQPRSTSPTIPVMRQVKVLHTSNSLIPRLPSPPIKPSMPPFSKVASSTSSQP